MPADDLDELYAVKPEGFTALRGKLAAAAKKRGDAAAAKQISAARKPTTAAWIVNRLALQHKDVKQRLSDLGDQLRAAHAAMDGERIRSLSTQQHQLINELTAAAFAAAEINPSAALREDVTDTLQAGIADPEVTAALGRLVKPEHWSGFGGLGEAASVSTKDRSGTARRLLDELQEAVAAAEQAKADADDALSQRQHELQSARLRHDEARRRLRDAERDLNAAERAYDRAKRASRDAAESVRDAKARLRAKH